MSFFDKLVRWYLIARALDAALRVFVGFLALVAIFTARWWLPLFAQWYVSAH